MKELRSQLRKVTIILCSLLCLVVSVRGFYEASLQKPDSLGSLVLAALATGLAYAIIKQYHWALRLMTAILLVTAVFLPVGVLNPFAAGDYLAVGREAAPVAETLLWLVPLEILILVIAFLIDPGRTNSGSDIS